MQIGEDLFRQWITQHHEVLYRHALWMTSNVDLSKDLVQDSYYQAWKYRTSLRDETKILPWLLTILRRMVYKECQHSDKKPVSFQDVELNSVLTAPKENTDAMIDLARGLNSLNVSQREILLLYALHGFTYEEISEQLEIPQGTVMSRLSRARKAMTLMQEETGVTKEAIIIYINERNRLRNNGEK